MGIQLMVDGAKQLGKEVWLLPLAPHEVQRLGDCRSAIGERSVILVRGPQFDQAKQILQFDAAGVTTLNVGTSAEAIVVAVPGTAGKAPSKASLPTPTDCGPGDAEFLLHVESLGPVAREAARKLLTIIRSESPGDLRRGQRRNFKNTPDNFWYVIVQPQAQSLSVTVRGEPDRFRPSRLELKDDRPGYTRFYVRSSADVDDAVAIIRASRKKL